MLPLCRTCLVALLIVTAGCHQVGVENDRWTLSPVINETAQTNGRYTTTVEFNLGGTTAPVVLNGVKVRFLTANKTLLNETTLGAIRFDWEEETNNQFTVVTPAKPHYVYLKYDEVKRPTDAVGGVNGLRLQQNAEGEYTYFSYENYTRSY
ncbi:hypothetical protein ACFQMA_18080 [Halosimplex aquaticum]|uniref:Uncharacterized protein n=1 Tax=Halosimplex aquaticum TaxID=3026162 RepID=A0ABD5Y326_9EURY|nr:hypothetical protein [Halosimplex aquaticum]